MGTTQDPIVVGYDGSTASEVALKWAAKAAHQSGMSLLIMHTADLFDESQNPNGGLSNGADGEAEAKSIAEWGSAIVRKAMPDQPVQIGGAFFSAQIDVQELSASTPMVVLGNHGESRIDTLGLAAAAYAIIGYAHCPVVIVQDGISELPGPGRPVVVGVTDDADRVVDTGAYLAQSWGAPLLLTTTWSAERTESGDPTESGDHTESTQAKHTNRQAVARVRAAHEDLNITGVVLQTEPVEGLTQSASNAGLLILGARVHSLAGAVLGSTSLGMLLQRKIPVMIVDLNTDPTYSAQEPLGES
ncbi:universal stress protein [Ornithinimicrobium sp. Arc0846-15]|nr:universal stress protein [Ornithinimicrobium laminariae]